MCSSDLNFYLLYLFLAALGLRCCAQAFSKLLQAGATGLLIAVASLVSEHGLLGSWASVAVACRPSSCSTRAQLLRGMWDLPRLGLEPVSPALAGGLPTTAPPGKSQAAVVFVPREKL